MNAPLPERLPARPVRQWLLAWHLWTGDPPALIAQGFDLNPELIEELLGPEPPKMLDRTTAQVLCMSLRCEPCGFWQPCGRMTCPHPDPWADLPRDFWMLRAGPAFWRVAPAHPTGPFADLFSEAHGRRTRRTSGEGD